MWGIPDPFLSGRVGIYVIVFGFWFIGFGCRYLPSGWMVIESATRTMRMGVIRSMAESIWSTDSLLKLIV